tara:strand:+ start:9843 stop:10844 length:1002 start_codon:yes stop_codon:yes gene_type:complete
MTKSTPLIEKAYRFSIAPMVDCTDSHFRVLMRQISKRALLYTEMIVAQALHHNKNKELFLNFEEIEHPISIQVGGDDPNLLSEAAILAESWGYDEINLNIGCPSSKVQSGNFGACMMAKPDQVAICVEAMANASSLPVTVKHRIGIDNLDSDFLLRSFVDKLSKAGAKRFSIHARKALLNGLNPKQNRTIPPLRYDKVLTLKNTRPELTIELNGGLNTPFDCLKALKTFDGAMVGRAAYKHPLLWKKMDELIFGEKKEDITASQVIRGLIPHAQKHLSNNGRLWDIGRHTLQLVENVPGAKLWRHEMTISCQKQTADINVLEKAAKRLEDEGL